MTLEEHLALMEQMAKEWHEKNDKPELVVIKIREERE